MNCTARRVTVNLLFPVDKDVFGEMIVTRRHFLTTGAVAAVR